MQNHRRQYTASKQPEHVLGRGTHDSAAITHTKHTRIHA